MSSRPSNNIFNPLCESNACLTQVIGDSRANAAIQYAACVSMLGAPSTEIITLPGDTILATATETVDYTNIVITTSTAYTTYEDIITTYIDVLDEITVYTTTYVSTIMPTVSPAPAKKRNVGRPGKCGRGPSATSSTSPTTFSSVTLPTSTGTVTSQTPTETTSAVPIASDCPDLAAYSSACSCIFAVDSTNTISEPGPDLTSTVYETVTNVVPVTSEAVVTLAVTTVIMNPVTTTLFTTLYTDAVATTVLPEATPYTQLVSSGGGLTNAAFMVRSGGQVGPTDVGQGANIGVIAAGGSPYLVGQQPAVQLYAKGPNSQFGELYFLAAADAASNDDLITCTVDASSNLSCSTSHGLNVLYRCGGYYYIGSSSWNQPGCDRMTLKAV